MAQKKYEFVEDDEKVIAPGIVVRRIRALIEIPPTGVTPAVRPGDLGGYIASEENLTQVSGDAWVSEKCERTPITISGFKYPITITDAHLRAGCQCYPIEKWPTFSKEEIYKMGGYSALEFYPKPILIMGAVGGT